MFVLIMAHRAANLIADNRSAISNTRKSSAAIPTLIYAVKIAFGSRGYIRNIKGRDNLGLL